MEKLQRTAGARLQAVDQTENGGVEPNPQQKRDQRKQPETGLQDDAVAHSYLKISDW